MAAAIANNGLAASFLNWNLQQSLPFSKWLVLASISVAVHISAKDVIEPDLSKLPPASTSKVDFIRDIQPMFASHCYECHGSEKQKADLRFDVKGIALQGGVSGPALRPGNSAESRLVHLVGGLIPDLVMPQKGERLTAAEIGLLRAWIDQGAPWPDGLEPRGYQDKKNHWAFKKPVRPSIPKVENLHWPRNPIDYFVLSRLEHEHLTPSPEADRVTLIRRLSFDVTGLPPTPEEVAGFVGDRSFDAYEKIVEKLLASPRYGERWARHWLDVVRFAESAGFETNLERKNAWPYRDFVIRAFNDDKPYERFILEQLAGDVLAVDEATGFIVGGPWDAVKSPDINLTLQQRMDELHDMVATTSSTFLGLTVGCARCHNHKFDPVTQRDYYAMQAVFAGVQHAERMLRPADYEERIRKADSLRSELVEIENQLVRFEPLATPGMLIDTNSAPPTTRAESLVAESERRSVKLRGPVNPKRNVERFAPVRARFVRFTIFETTGVEPCIDELEVYSTNKPARNVALASYGTIATASGTYPNSELHKLEHINDGQVGNSRSWISNEPGRGWVQLEFPEPAWIERIVWGRDREEKFKDRLPTKYRIEAALDADHWKAIAGSNDRASYDPKANSAAVPSLAWLTAPEAAEAARLLDEKQRREARLKQLTNFPMIYAGRFEAPGPTHRLHRGEAMQQREVVPPGALSAFSPKLELPATTPEQQRRIALARWLTDSENPLTARVMVNRIWQYHFGDGLVRTPSDFGLNGARPSHQELLDWLAAEFIARGWSVKAIHRLILLSSTYRQSSAPNAAALAIDSGDRWLWRFRPRRLEAEALRDSILWLSASLDLKMGGPGFDLFEPNNNYVKVYNPKTEFGPTEWRRMVYQSKPRMRLDDTFGAFDCPDAGQIAPRRTSSTTPLQSLNLLNSPFMIQQAGLLAERLKREASSEAAGQARRAFWLAFSREPSANELTAATNLISEHGLFAFCRALLNANEFLYVF